jgi:hypothetical protein
MLNTTLAQQLSQTCVAPTAEYASYSDYGYTPSLAAGVVFSVIFGLAMIAHTVQFIWTKYWWCSVFSIGAMGKSHDHAVTSTYKQGST